MATTPQPQNVDLFGNSTLTPRQLMQQQLAQIMQDTAAQTAGADPRTQGTSMMGAALGGLLGNVLIDKGILPKPPEMQRAENLAKARDAIQQDAAAKGITPQDNPSQFADLAASHFLRAGDEQAAMHAISWKQQQEALQRTADMERARTLDANAQVAERLGQFTPESRKVYMQTGNPGDLQPDPNQRANLGAAQLAETTRHNKAMEAAANPFAAGGGGPIDSNLHGDAVLATVPSQIASQVKALAEGRMQFPAGFALKSPYWQHMISLVSQYDPSFDAVNYNSRSSTRKDFTSGKSAQTINALNTVLGHIGQLDKAATALDNSRIPWVNTIGNYLQTQSGDPRVKNFNTTRKAVVDELTRVYRQTGGSEQDIKTWAENLDSSNSPAQLKGVINQVGDLLESKLQALGAQYQQGMGTTEMPIQLVTPHAQETLDRIRGSAGTSAPATPSPQNQKIDDLLKKYGPKSK